MSATAASMKQANNNSIANNLPPPPPQQPNAVAAAAAAAAAVSIRSTTTTKQDDDYWVELQRTEKKRLEIINWVEQPFWQTLFHWNGTVLHYLFCDSLLWITMFIYILLRILARFGLLPDFLADVAKGNIAVIGTFITFFLVFYVNQSHKRFTDLYGESMKCKGRIFDVATIAVTVLPMEQASRLVRYMNAAHIAGYVGLSSVYPSGSFFRHLNEQLALLTNVELKRMKEIDLDKGGSCNRELLTWAMKEIQIAQNKKQVDAELATYLRGEICKLRAAIGELYNAKDLPIPFFYVHFICLLTVMYLPLFALTTALNVGTGADVHWIADVVAGLVVFLQSIFVIGLRILGQKFSDPYGSDLVDLSVLQYCTFIWTNSQRILNSYFPDEPADGAIVEEELTEKRMFIGAAWEHAYPVETSLHV